MKTGKNKPLIIAVIICALVLAVIIVVFAFLDCWIGYAKLGKIRREIAECDEILITSPLYYDAYSSGAEASVVGDEAKKLVSDFLDVSEKKSFDGTVGGGVGFWDTRIIFYVGEESFTVYVKNDSFYVTGKNGYLFIPDDTEAYSQFYSDVCDLLEREGITI